jgi:coenzyme F420-reducing hydrogenase delta subunit/ferredoxin
MCSGRIGLDLILRAFSKGIDGVLVGGCRLGECNYITHGNYHTLNTVLLCKKIMEHIGLNPDRLRMEFMAAGDGIHFSQVVNEFTVQVRSLGPLGMAEGIDKNELLKRNEWVNRLVPYIKLKMNDKLVVRHAGPEEYADFFTSEEIASLLGKIISYYIDPQKCQACGMCLRRCPMDAISGGKKQLHVIDQNKCIRCGSCLDACPPRFSAVRRLSGEPVSTPLPKGKRALASREAAGYRCIS